MKIYVSCEDLKIDIWTDSSVFHSWQVNSFVANDDDGDDVDGDDVEGGAGDHRFFEEI